MNTRRRLGFPKFTYCIKKNPPSKPTDKDAPNLMVMDPPVKQGSDLMFKCWYGKAWNNFKHRDLKYPEYNKYAYVQAYIMFAGEGAKWVYAKAQKFVAFTEAKQAGRDVQFPVYMVQLLKGKCEEDFELDDTHVPEPMAAYKLRLPWWRGRGAHAGPPDKPVWNDSAWAASAGDDGAGDGKKKKKHTS